MPWSITNWDAILCSALQGIIDGKNKRLLTFMQAAATSLQAGIPWNDPTDGAHLPWGSETVSSVAELHYSFTRALLSLVVFDSDLLHSLATRKTCNKGLGVSQISWRRFVLNPKNCQARQVELPCDPMMWGTWSRDVEEWSPWIGSFFLFGERYEKSTQTITFWGWKDIWGAVTLRPCM